jgi:hypothetical protein
MRLARAGAEAEGAGVGCAWGRRLRCAARRSATWRRRASVEAGDAVLRAAAWAAAEGESLDASAKAGSSGAVSSSAEPILLKFKLTSVKSSNLKGWCVRDMLTAEYHLRRR